jgi:hypothetical protein
VANGEDPETGFHAEVRDLTSTATTTLDGLYLNGWSSNGEWALGGSVAGNTVLRTGGWQRAGTIPAEFDVLTVLDDGSVLAYRPGAAQARSRLALDVLNPTGSVARRLDIDVSGIVHANEFVDYSTDEQAVRTHAVGIRVGDDFGVLQLSYDGDGQLWLASGPFVIFDADDGTVRHRVDLPGFDPRLPAWGLRGLSGGRIVVSHRTDTYVAVETLDPASATLVPRFTVTADHPLRIVAPGDTR